MRNVAILGNKTKELLAKNPSVSTIDLHGVPVNCGIVATRPPAFESGGEKDRTKVLANVTAFSCNYRDQALILTASKRGPENSFYTIGSDFVGEVIAVGDAVEGFAVGDKVIGDYSYVGAQFVETPYQQGVATNHSSTEYQAFDANKIIKVPLMMPNEVAGAFSVNAQTAYSIVRKLEVKEGDDVLVTAARSHTSMFAISRLRKNKANIYALTTSKGYEEQFAWLGVKEVLQVDSRLSNLAEDPRVLEVARTIGGFDYVIDPFYDLYLPKVVYVMAPGGKYISCGFWGQYHHLTDEKVPDTNLSLHMALIYSIANNLQILFSCLGDRSDLQNAIDDYAAGDLDVVIDSVHTGNEVGTFLKRTYMAQDRFGKVVYQYN
jgi:NADPH:quinone reductase-like Zn-dependent oxidoreductase